MSFITITHYPDRPKCEVTCRFGPSKTQVKNLPSYQAEAFVRNYIISCLKRYVNHRDEILRHHGGDLTREKDFALRQLQRALPYTRKMALPQVVNFIDAWQYQLILIRPGMSSKFYEHDTRLLGDLLHWAGNQLEKRNGYEKVS